MTVHVNTLLQPKWCSTRSDANKQGAFSGDWSGFDMAVGFLNHASEELRQTSPGPSSHPTCSGRFAEGD